MPFKKRGQLPERLCRVDNCRNCVFEALNRARFALPQSETSQRSEVRHSIASQLESLNSCWVGRLVYDIEKCKVVSSA